VSRRVSATSIIIVSWTSSIDAAGIWVHNMNSHDGKDNNNHHYEKRERFPDLDHVDVDEANAVVQALRTHDMMDITTTVIMLVIILQIASLVTNETWMSPWKVFWSWMISISTPPHRPVASFRKVISVGTTVTGGW
jgi:hypothetical protein